mgnify:FL=1
MQHGDMVIMNMESRMNEKNTKRKRVGEQMKVALTEENVTLTGRTYREGDTVWLALSGTGVAFDYTGKRLAVTVVGGAVAGTPDNEINYARFAVYADGKRVLDERVMQKEKEYVLWESGEEGTVRIEIIKLSESPMSVMGLRDILIGEGEKICPLPRKEHLIEFIGDSITCGYGVDDEDPLHSFSTATEDVTKAYAYLTAEQLDADYTMFSASGYGIISGYTDDPQKKCSEQLIPLYYHSYGFSYDTMENGVNPKDLAWDFTKREPDAIVINLGTNDDSYCQDEEEKQKEYRDQYVVFLKDVRSKNPDATIFCVLGLMGARLFPRICEACRIYSAETGDRNIHTFELPEQDGTIGYVADYHPLHGAHEKAADVLNREIKTVMGW